MKYFIFAIMIIAALCIHGCAKFDVNSSGLQHTISDKQDGHTAKNSTTTASNASISQTRTVVEPEQRKKQPQGSAQTISIFYANSKKDPNAMHPEVTYPAKVTIESKNITELAEKAINKLLAGPGEEDVKKGYYTLLPEGIKLNSIKIDENNITADFSAKLNEGGGSCEMTQRRSQIENTLAELPGAQGKKIRISVGGNYDKVLQP